MLAHPPIHIDPLVNAGSSPVGLLFGVLATKFHSSLGIAWEKYAIVAMQDASMDGREKAGG